MMGAPLEVKGSIWIEVPGGLKMGIGRATLLQQIEETGSIAEAARLQGMSYKKAWSMVQALNQSSALPLVQKHNGGKNGGGTVLTEEGKKVMLTFWQVFGQFEAFKLSSSQTLQLS